MLKCKSRGDFIRLTLCAAVRYSCMGLKHCFLGVVRGAFGLLQVAGTCQRIVTLLWHRVSAL